MCGDIDELTTTENIVKFIMYDSETDQLSPEEEMYIQMIYDHLKTFRKECLCLNCIRAWLLSMIQDNEDADKVQHHITNMLEDLAKYSYITNNDNDVDDGHSKTCFFEHQIKDWFSETITIDQSTYSKLQRNKENDKLGTLELPEGLFLLNGVKIYHRLNRGNKKVAYHTLSSGSTTENMEDDIEVPSETNQQQKENVNFGYENSSKEVRPNSSTDLNLSGMSNSHSSEWDSLMQYKSTY